MSPNIRQGDYHSARHGAPGDAGTAVFAPDQTNAAVTVQQMYPPRRGCFAALARARADSSPAAYIRRGTYEAPDCAAQGNEAL